MTKAANKKIVSIRSDKKIALATAMIGWSEIATPSEMFNKYSLDYPSSEFNDTVTANINKEFAALLPLIKEELGAAKISSEASTLEEHLEESSTTPSDSYGVKNFGNFLRLALEHKEGVSKRTGKEYMIAPRVYDSNKNLIPYDQVPSLLPGSVVRPIVQLGLYSPSTVKKDMPRDILTSVKLWGLILVEPKVRGGGGGLDDSFFDGIDGDASEEEFDQEDF